MARGMGEVDVEVLPGIRALELHSSPVNCERSTCRRVDSSLSALVPWASDPGKEVTTGTRHPFSPSGYTTCVSD